MIELIPAIDIIDGKCVRLSKGDYTTQKVYNNDPLEVAKEFEDYGFKRLHMVDLDGARSKSVVNHHTLLRIAQGTSLTIDFGGGIKRDEDLTKVFECGASMVTIGSIAVNEPDLFLGWLKQYGSEKIILGADVQDETVRISGWLESGGVNLYDFVKRYLKEGVTNVLCTDISKDGMLKGPSIALYRHIMEQAPCHLIASGGISSMDDIISLDEAGIPAVVFGKAIYEGRISLNELSRWAGF